MNKNRQPFTNFEVIANALCAGEIKAVLDSTAETVFEDFPEVMDELRINDSLFPQAFEAFKNFLTEHIDDEHSEQILIAVMCSECDKGTKVTINGCGLSNNGYVMTNEECFRNDMREIFQIIICN